MIEEFTNSGLYKILNNMGYRPFEEPLNSNYHEWFLKISGTNNNLSLATRKMQNLLHQPVVPLSSI